MENRAKLAFQKSMIEEACSYVIKAANRLEGGQG